MAKAFLVVITYLISMFAIAAAFSYISPDLPEYMNSWLIAAYLITSILPAYLVLGLSDGKTTSELLRRLHPKEWRASGGIMFNLKHQLSSAANEIVRAFFYVIIAFIILLIFISLTINFESIYALIWTPWTLLIIAVVAVFFVIGIRATIIICIISIAGWTCNYLLNHFIEYTALKNIVLMLIFGFMSLVITLARHIKQSNLEREMHIQNAILLAEKIDALEYKISCRD